MIVNEPYFNFKDFCNCDPNETNTKCKIYPKGNLDISNPNKVIYPSVHCKLGSDFSIISKCPPENKRCVPGMKGSLAAKNMLIVDNINGNTPEAIQQAKSKCKGPFIYDRYDGQHKCSMLPEPYMQVINKSDGKYITVSNTIYESMEQQFNNIQDINLMTCISKLDPTLNGNLVACYQNIVSNCQADQPRDKIQVCIINKLKEECISKIEANSIQPLNNCLKKYKDYTTEQIKCPPNKQNYGLECIDNSYNYDVTISKKEILDKNLIDRYTNYTANICPPTYVKDNITYKYFDETPDECIYASIYPYEEKQINSYYCTTGWQNLGFKNICENTLDGRGKPMMMTGCNIYNFLPFSTFNSTATCATKCEPNYGIDRDMFTNGNNCIRQSSTPKTTKIFERSNLGTAWKEYCSIDNNIMSDDNCIKTTNILEEDKILIGVSKVLGDLNRVTSKLYTYEMIANQCTTINGNVYTIERQVYIPSKSMNADLEIKTISNISFVEYLKYCNYSGIYLDEYLINGIMEGEFKTNIKSYASNLEGIYGYTIDFIRASFYTDQSDCCDMNGNSYYLNSNIEDPRINPGFRSKIIIKPKLKSTCDINISKLKNNCAEFSSNIEKARECLTNNPDECPTAITDKDIIDCLKNKKNMCLTQLQEYCSSGGLNRWGDGIPRIIDNNKRCNIDFKRKYPNDYDKILNGICNTYDNSENEGVTYYKTSNICIDYCKTKGLQEVIEECKTKKLNEFSKTEEYKNNYQIRGNLTCPPNINLPKCINCVKGTCMNNKCVMNLDINGNCESGFTKQGNICIGSLCIASNCIVGNCKTDFINNFNKPYLDNFEQQCRSENQKYDGCDSAKYEYCTKIDTDNLGNKFTRFFTPECQEFLKPRKDYGMIMQGKCVMNRRDISYNTPECQVF
jgi:hypothetical protein